MKMYVAWMEIILNLCIKISKMYLVLLATAKEKTLKLLAKIIEHVYSRSEIDWKSIHYWPIN